MRVPHPSRWGTMGLSGREGRDREMNQTASITRIKYGATVLLNADTDYRQYNPGDALVYDNRTLLEISEDSVSEALDEAFRIGNRMGADREGTEWSSNVRSVSVGD